MKFASGLAFLGRNGTLLLALGIFIGIGFPGLARAARPLVDFAIFVTTFMAMLRVDWPAFLGYLRRPGLVAAFDTWKLVLFPLLLSIAILALPAPPALRQALVLASAGPPIMSATVLAAMLGLDPALALAGVVSSTLIVPLVLPIVALHLLGLDISIGAGPLFLRMAFFIGGSLVVALAIQKLVGAERMRRRNSEVAGVAVLGMLLFAIAIMDGVTDLIMSDPWRIAGFTLASFGLNLLGQAVAGLLFLRAGRKRALTAALMAGNSNMGLILAGLGGSASPEFALLVAVGQLPIYILPLLTAPLFRRLLAGQPA